MRGYLSDDVVATWLGDLVQNSTWVSLHFAVPVMSDPGASEVFDAGYVRSSVVWQFVSTRSFSNSGPLMFNLSAGTVVLAVGLHRSAVDPLMQAYAEPNLVSELVVSDSGRLVIPTGELVFSIA